MIALSKASPKPSLFRLPETFAKPYSGRRNPPSGRRGPQGVFGRSRNLHGRGFPARPIRRITSVADLLALKPVMDKTTWVYDPATGLLTQKLDAANKGTTYTYTPAGQLATRTCEERGQP